MIYFSSKGDLKFIVEFNNDVKFYISIESRQQQGGSVASVNAALQEARDCRERIAQGIPRAIRIARSLRIPVDLKSYPSPLVGGPLLRVNVFEAILNDDGHGKLPHQRKLDILNETIGALSELVRKERTKAINPLFWINEALKIILRAPFWVLETAGFKSESFEKSLAGKIVRFIEILAIVGLLIYLGFTDGELKELIKARLS